MNFVPAVAGLSASFIAGIGLGCNVTVVRRYEYANVPALEAARWTGRPGSVFFRKGDGFDGLIITYGNLLSSRYPMPLSPAFLVHLTTRWIWKGGPDN